MKRKTLPEQNRKFILFILFYLAVLSAFVFYQHC
jgi:hypothetical protein